jgi:hypothetical protein
MKMETNRDPYDVQSPWGAIAAFFLVQCFGYVTLQGFRMFISIGLHGEDRLSIFGTTGMADRVLLAFWGLMWIFAFLAFQADVFRRISKFCDQRGVVLFLRALKAPSEMLKAATALLFALIYLSFVLGHYPFPGQPISMTILVLYGVFGWAVSALVAWALRKRPVRATREQHAGKVGAIVGFLIGAVFFVVAQFVEPGLFYFHGMIGLGVMTMIACKLLFRGPRIKGMPNQALDSTA